MGCIIKLKLKEEYITFESEAEAKEYIKKNKLQIASDLKTWKDETPSEYLTYSTPQEKTEKIIKESHSRSYESTKKSLIKMQLNGWNSEVYSKESDAFGISTFLSGLTINEKRLFPEYITDNYLNVLIQNSICEYFLKSQGTEYDHYSIDNLRRSVFDETLKINAKDAKLKSAKEWLDYFNRHHDKKITIDDDTLKSFDDNAQNENNKNFEAMLRGEIIHKIFEEVINNHSDNQIKSAVRQMFAADGDFYKKYGDNYTEVRDSKLIIDSISNTIDSKLDSYIKVCKTYKSELLKRFKGTDIKLLSEKRITADLTKNITIDGITKNKIRGKLDLIVLVDGVPHIVDLKVSHNAIGDWHFEKTLKTKYQLAAYYRLLNRIGINTNRTTTNVLGITINSNGDINENETILENWTSSVVHNNTINQNLEEIFGIVKKEPTIDISLMERFDEHVRLLFGDGISKVQRTYSEDRYIDYIKNRAVLKDGVYTVTYKLFHSDGKFHWHKDTIKKDEYEEAVKSIAKKIHSSYENRFLIVYNQFVSDVEAYIEGTKNIEDFECAKEDSDMIAHLKSILIKYKNSDNKIIFPEIGEKFNTIFIKTPLGIDAIKCSHIDPHSPWDITNKHATLFNSPGVKTTSLKKTVGNVHVASTLLLLNELIGGSNENIGEILSIDLSKHSAYKCTVERMKEINEVLHDILSLNDVGIVKYINDDSFVDPLQNVMLTFTAFLDDTGKFRGKKLITREMSKNDKTNIFEIINGKNPLSFLETDPNDFKVKDKIETLKMLRNSLISNFPDYFKDVTAKTIIVDEITALRYMIENAISIYENREFIIEADISKYGLSKGFYLASMDLIPEENIQTVNTIVQNGFNKVRTRFQKQRLTLKQKLDTFKSKNGFGSFRQYGIGDVSTNYFNLFERDSKGELIDGDLRFRNPWTDNGLNEHEREFIKYVLFVLNKQRYRWKTLSDLSQNKLKFEDYFCPLMRAKGLDRFRDVEKGGIRFNFFTKSYFNELLIRAKNTWQDAGQLLEGQQEERTKASDLLKSMYNEFKTRTDLELRQEYINSAGGINSFTMDIETILDSVFLAENMEEIFELDVLPQVQSVLFVSAYQANLTDLKMPNFQEFVKEYMKNAVYGDTIINDEAKKFFKVMGPVRSAGAAIALSYNVTNLPRELLMGFFTNISRAMFNSYGEETFSLKDYLHAFGILTGDIPRFMHNVTKIELLNELYGMSNMSISEIPEQVTSNKTGIFALGGRFSTWTIVAPDYWNRMSMFISQMIHDGCWEAYELKTNEIDGATELVYDMSKDKRFDILYKYRFAQVNSERITEIPKELRETFNKQLALYNIIKQDLNNELEVEDRPRPLENPDPNADADSNNFEVLTRAYTNKQRNSMKSFADLAFGYYDREVKAHFFKTSIGLTFKQFMAYMSAKKMQYFQVRSNTTSRGSYKQLEDAKGNKIWSVRIGNEIKIVTEEVLNNEYAEYKDYAQPKLAWTGTYMEGILQSYMHLFHDLSVGSYKALKGDGTDMLKQVWKEYGKKGDIRHSNMLQGLWDLLIGIMMPWLLTVILFDDPEKSGKSIKKQKGEMSVLGQNAYYIADAALKDFNIFSAMTKFAFEWEAPSFSILQNSFRQFWTAFGDEDLTLAEEFLKGTTRSVGAFRFWRPVVDDMIEN